MVLISNTLCLVSVKGEHAVAQLVEAQRYETVGCELHS